MRTRCIFSVLTLSIAMVLPLLWSGPAASQAPDELTLAYIGEDHNVWVQSFPDGDPVQVTTDDHGSVKRFYFDPQWSPDGDRLVFWSDGSQGITVIHYWDGTLVHDVPDTGTCKNARFSPDGTRIFFSCAMYIDHSDPAPPDVSADPRNAIVTSSALDGSDMQPALSYVTEGTTGIHWSPGGPRLKDALLTDVDPLTGNLLVSGYQTGPFGWAIFSPDGTRIDDHLGTVIGTDGPYDAVYANDSESLLIRWCLTSCVGSNFQDAEYQLARVSPDGTVLEEYTILTGAYSMQGYSSIPNSESIVVSAKVDSSTPAYILLLIPGEDLVILASGKNPAVKP